MATCHHCGHAVDPTATNCPNCGTLVTETRMVETSSSQVASILGGLVLGSVIGLFLQLLLALVTLPALGLLMSLTRHSMSLRIVTLIAIAAAFIALCIVLIPRMIRWSRGVSTFRRWLMVTTVIVCLGAFTICVGILGGVGAFVQ